MLAGLGSIGNRLERFVSGNVTGRDGEKDFSMLKKAAVMTGVVLAAGVAGCLDRGGDGGNSTITDKVDWLNNRTGELSNASQIIGNGFNQSTIDQFRNCSNIIETGGKVAGRNFTQLNETDLRNLNNCLDAAKTGRQILDGNASIFNQTLPAGDKNLSASRSVFPVGPVLGIAAALGVGVIAAVLMRLATSGEEN